MNHLLLTLGHNSSAILVRDGKIVWGYETERVTGVKSDSRFPAAVLELTKLRNVDLAYVTHWEPSGDLLRMSAKHFDPSALSGVPILTHSAEMSHHDTHLYAALSYAGPYFPYHDNSYAVVIDGFGTCGEHISIYKLDTPVRLIYRAHGYATSLGLFYQYATAFMGMKMHEDEYKLLGYEVHVAENEHVRIQAMARTHALDWLRQMGESVYGSQYDPLYSLNALDNVRSSIFRHLNEVCLKLHISNPTSTEGRILLAHYVQSVLEFVVLDIVKAFNPTNLILSGGVFYNVKLNKQIFDQIPGKLCVYPLAGDQGNAIGLYSRHWPTFTFPSHLNWGLRTLRPVGDVPNLVVTDENSAYEIVLDKLRTVGYVNLVRGNMEFGPRAMCNTSTLAIPTSTNVQIINETNNRNTVMPMAPVMTYDMFENLFIDTDRVWNSHEHMILAMQYREDPGPHLSGAAHRYKFPPHYTGRPQVVRSGDMFMTNLLNEVGTPLINTSFNFHGKPIALGMDSIVDNHMMQHARNSNIYTVVIEND